MLPERMGEVGRNPRVRLAPELKTVRREPVLTGDDGADGAEAAVVKS